MAKKAIAYLSDVILGTTGEVIDRATQRAEIEKFAAEEQIEIVAWFEDEAYEEDLLKRPGLQALLACDKGCELVLVERVWCLSRQMSVLAPFLERLQERQVRLEASTHLWDCVSQMVRQHHKGGLKRFKTCATPLPAAGRRPAATKARVARPAHAHFSGLKRAPRHA